MQKIRLTEIGLRLDGREFAIGDELVVGEDLSHELAHSRLTAKTAELVLIGEALSPEFQAALNDLVGLLSRLQAAMAAACHQALAAPGPAEAMALVAAFMAYDRPMDEPEAAFRAVRDRVLDHEDAERARIQSAAGAEISPRLGMAPGEKIVVTRPAAETPAVPNPSPSEAAPAATTSPITPATSGASGAAAGAKASAAKPKKPAKPKAPAIPPGAAKGAS